MRKIAAEMEAVDTRADPVKFDSLNRELHATIVARCPNDYLLDLLDQSYSRLDRGRSTMFVFLPHRSGEAVREHAQLIARLQDGSRDEVEGYARWHKMQTLAAYQALHVAKDKVLAAWDRSTSRASGMTEPAPLSSGTPGEITGETAGETATG